MANFGDRKKLTSQLDLYQSRFAGLHMAMVLDSMRSENTAGALWDIPQPSDSSLLLLWDKANNVLYFGGQPSAPSYLASLAAVVADHVSPTAQAAGRSRFKIRTLSTSLESSLPLLFPKATVGDMRSMLFLCDGLAEISAPPPAIPNLAVLSISTDLLASDVYINKAHLRDEIRAMWPCEERFLTCGFGSVAIVGNEIVCWCTSEYVGPTHCGIGIETIPAYEGRGVATATAAHFVHEARKRGLIACWECDVSNHGSLRVAEKLGFLRQSEETYRIGSFTP